MCVDRPKRARRSAPPADLDRLVFRTVTKSRWPDFEAFFQSPGAPKYCWCMAWRVVGEETKVRGGSLRKPFMEKRIRADTPVGVLAYLDEQPVGWVSIAPRETHRSHRSLGGPEAAPGERIWSLVCFYVPRRLRRQGMMRRLIEAAVDYARTDGATVVEAYPVEPESPSYRHMGFIPAFEKAGFREVGLAGSRRHVMRLSLHR